MIKFEEAISILESVKATSSSEKVKLPNSLGRVLAEDVLSDIDMPPFNKSAMDGYAIRRQDINNDLEVLGVIKAGETPSVEIQKNQCVKIMTGAIVPPGADCVIIVEETEVLPNKKVKYKGTYTKSNIAIKAEDIAQGDTVLRKGTIIRPQEIAILATVGCTDVNVYKRPRVAVVSTGDEIVEPDTYPANGKIRNSNAFQLLAQLKKMSVEADYRGIVEDTKEAMTAFLEEAMTNYDVVLLTGGISMGDYDYVPEVLQEIGVKLHIQKIAIKPGKPTVFGSKGNAFVFGLPGNPVSSFVIFELFTKAFLYKLMGHTYKPLEMTLPMKEDFKVKNSHRLSWVPVSITDTNEVLPVSYHGSAHIYALCFAQGIMPVKPGTSLILKGEPVNVRQI